MPRVTPHDVAEVLDTDLDSVELSTFVSDANTIVNKRCEPYTDDEGALADVETYLAAHLATTKEPEVSSLTHQNVRVDLDIDSKRYWNKAVMLDPTGRLDKPDRGYSTFSTGNS